MKKQSRMFQRVLLALVLSVGALVACGLSMTFLESIFRPFMTGNPVPSLDFTADGVPFLQRYDPDSQAWVYTDLDGNPLEPDASFEPYGGSHSVGLSYRSRLDLDDDRGRPLAWSMRIQSFQVDDRRVPVAFWYLIAGERVGEGSYFVGYAVKSKQRIGFIGTAGFGSELPPSDQRFDVRDSATWSTKENDDDDASGPNPYLAVLNCGSQVFGVNLESRQVETILSDQQPPVRSVNTLFRRRKGNFLVVLTEDAIRFIKPHGETERFPLPEQLRRQDLTVAMRSDGGLAVAIYHKQVFGSPVQPISIYQLAADGTAGEPREIQLATYQSSGEYIVIGLGSPLLLVAPPMLDFFAWQRYEGLESWGQYVQLALWAERWPILGTAAIGALLGALCYRRQARYRLPLGQRIFWPVFVFLLGIPGWIGYRFCRHWPPLEACPACHVPAPRDEEACAVCDREFPLPAAKGTEIFA